MRTCIAIEDHMSATVSLTKQIVVVEYDIPRSRRKCQESWRMCREVPSSGLSRHKHETTPGNKSNKKKPGLQTFLIVGTVLPRGTTGAKMLPSMATPRERGTTSKRRRSAVSAEVAFPDKIP